VTKNDILKSLSSIQRTRYATVPAIHEDLKQLAHIIELLLRHLATVGVDVEL
jgi:hypothetical protein